MSNHRTSQRQALQQRIDALGPWFQNIELDGIATAPNHVFGDYPRFRWQRFCDALPADMAGKSVLDIGCNAGFYAVELKRRGAELVVGIDSDADYLKQAELVAEVLELDIELRQMTVYDVGQLGQRFDVVLFLGVLYHLRHPLLALDLIHEHVVDDLLVFQSMQRGSDRVSAVATDYDFSEASQFDEPGYPKLHFVEHSYAHDPTNWWIPNRACAEAMLRSAGFSIEAQPEAEVYLCRR